MITLKYSCFSVPTPQFQRAENWCPTLRQAQSGIHPRADEEHTFSPDEAVSPPPVR